MPINELINASLYVIALLIYLRRVRKVDTYFLLMFAFAFTAIISLLYEASGMSTYHTKLFPYFYMFLCFWLCFKPFQKLEIGSSLFIKETPLIKALMWIYIVTGILSAYITVPDAIATFALGDYGNLRNSVYVGEDIALYANQYERLCKNINSYLSPFGVVVTFFQLTKPKKNWILIVILFSIWIINTFFGAALTASRGVVVALVLRLLLIFLIFKPVIPAKVQRAFFIILSSVCIPVFLYLMAVTVSRFGEYDANDSIFRYLGHAMQNLNENCIGPMEHFAWGKYAFSSLGNFLGFDFSTQEMYNLGYSGGTGFYTFLGAFYIDYGFVGTLLLCILLSRLIGHFTSKQNLFFSDLMVIVYFASFFLNGVFVVGLGYALGWIMLIVLYMIVKFTEKQV